MVSHADEYIMIVLPEEYVSELEWRTVTLKCENNERRRVRNPTPNEIKTIFHKWNVEVEFCSAGRNYGNVGFIFNTAGVAERIAGSTLESEGWLFFPSNLGRGVKLLRLGAIIPKIKVEWVLAAVLESVNNYKVLNVEVTVTLLFGGMVWKVWP